MRDVPRQLRSWASAETRRDETMRRSSNSRPLLSNAYQTAWKCALRLQTCTLRSIRDGLNADSHLQMAMSITLGRSMHTKRFLQRYKAVQHMRSGPMDASVYGRG
jgi:hypothetical protein